MKITKNVKKKIMITVAVLILFQIGSTMTIPSVNNIQGNSSLNNFNIIFNQNFSWFMLGITPCISSNMIIMILSAGVSPMFTRWKKEGFTSAYKLERAKYFFTVIMSFILGMFFIRQAQMDNTYIFIQKPEIIAGYITIGSLIVVYLSNIIEKEGIGNGLSVLVFFTIIKSFILNILTASTQLKISKEIYGNVFITVMLFVVFIGTMTIIMYWFDCQKKVIEVDDENSDYNCGKSQIAFLYNSAGITPIFFASILLSLISTLLTKANLNTTGFIDNCLFYIIFIVMMFVCSYLNISPKKRAKAMETQGLIIPKITPGLETKAFLKKEVFKTTCCSIAFIILIDIIFYFLNLYTIFGYLKIDTITFLLLGNITHVLIDSIKTLLHDRNHLERLF